LTASAASIRAWPVCPIVRSIRGAAESVLEVGSQSRRAVLERMVPRDIVELDHHASKRVLLIERKRADPRIDIVTLVRSGSVSPIRIVSRHRFFDLLHILVEFSPITMPQLQHSIYIADE